MAREPKDSIFGWLRGEAWDRGDTVAPAVSPREWNTLKERDALNAARPARRRRHRKKPGRKSR